MYSILKKNHVTFLLSPLDLSLSLYQYLHPTVISLITFFPFFFSTFSDPIYFNRHFFMFQLQLTLISFSTFVLHIIFEKITRIFVNEHNFLFLVSHILFSPYFSNSYIITKIRKEKKKWTLINIIYQLLQ
jgi:hypothetical protein